MPFHTPVLLKEVIAYLNPKAGEIVVDGTLGGAGHAQELSKVIGPTGKLIGIDLDPQAIKAAEEAGLSNAVFVKGSYANIDSILEELGINKVDRILIDIGISSYDLDQSKRGFSFQKDEPLDMRFDPENKPDNKSKEPFTAKFILETYSEKDLEKIFNEYGEEKFSKKISRAIVNTRQEKPILTTTDLFELIKRSLPAPIRFKAADSARRIFQSLRIEVNKELDNLKSFLPKAFSLLNGGARMAVISFHSLEDRMVKQFFLEKSKGCICPPEFPQCVCGRNPEGKIITKKPIIASEEEIETNPRSKPAKLRVLEKI